MRPKEPSQVSWAKEYHSPQNRFNGGARKTRVDTRSLQHGTRLTYRILEKRVVLRRATDGLIVLVVVAEIHVMIFFSAVWTIDFRIRKSTRASALAAVVVSAVVGIELHGIRYKGGWGEGDAEMRSHES